MSASLKPIRLAASLLILPLAACETPTTATDAKRIAESIGHVRPSKRDTCETQQQVAAQSSRIDSIVSNKEVVYKPEPCKAPAVVASAPPPKS